MSPTRPDWLDGERLKHEAHSLFEALRPGILRRTQRRLLAILLQGGTATIDDVRPDVELPPGVDPRCFGAVPGALARAGIIRCTERFPKSRRPIAHARRNAEWELADREKALEWLARNPEPKGGSL